MSKLIKGSTIAASQLFVISDLHIGDGSAKDMLCRQGKEQQLLRFLDFVEAQGGELLILGDLFELWRFDIRDVVSRWGPLLDRFDALKTKFIPGNHDVVLLDDSVDVTVHPFFARLCRPYMQRIGDKRFRFMHGHEVDPFIPKRLDKWGKRLGTWAGWVEMNSDLCLTACDPMVDVFLELGEQIIHVWQWITRNVNRTLHEELTLLSEEGLKRLKRGLRTRKMLSRFCRQRDDGAYDVAIVGHTHHAGYFNQWYYNSGCWTKPVNNFLKIWPDGHVEVFDWDGHQESVNQSLIGA